MEKLLTNTSYEVHVTCFSQISISWLCCMIVKVCCMCRNVVCCFVIIIIIINIIVTC